MKYLTADHTTPPRHVTQNGRLIPTRPLIAAQNTAKLAELGIYPHVTAPGAAPLGYTDWVLVDGQYVREPAGTQEERDAAELVQQRELMQITRLQARLMLLETPAPSGTFTSAWDAVQAWAQTQAADVQAFFEDAQNWKRNDPNVAAGAVAFGWDAATLDALFEQASAI